MKHLNEGYFRRPGTPDLMIHVVKVRYRGPDYCNAIIELLSTRTGACYQTIKNCKLFYKNITHWKKITRGA